MKKIKNKNSFLDKLIITLIFVVVALSIFLILIIYNRQKKLNVPPKPINKEIEKIDKDEKLNEEVLEEIKEPIKEIQTKINKPGKAKQPVPVIEPPVIIPNVSIIKSIYNPLDLNPLNLNIKILNDKVKVSGTVPKIDETLTEEEQRLLLNKQRVIFKIISSKEVEDYDSSKVTFKKNNVDLTRHVLLEITDNKPSIKFGQLFNVGKESIMYSISWGDGFTTLFNVEFDIKEV